ncbi:hypothetical protein Q5I06_08620, partial [Helicobacter sp. faydin-H76]
MTFSKNGLFNITKDSNKNDVYHFTELNVSGNPGNYKSPSGTATFYIDSAILDAQSQKIRVANGQNIDMYFKNAVYKGDFIFDQGGYAIPTYYTFDGNYNGNTDTSLKGKAFVGNAYINANAPVFTFKNGAVADITDFKTSSFNASWFSYGLNLDSASKVSINNFSVTLGIGVINVKNQSDLKINTFGYRVGDLTVNVTNQSVLDMGTVTSTRGPDDGWTWGVDAPPTPKKVINVDNSTLKGNFTLAPQIDGWPIKNKSTGFQFNFKNNAKFEGKIYNNIGVTKNSTG